MEEIRNTYKNVIHNATAKWLAFMLCIQKVANSNLGLQTGYPDGGFLWFSPVPAGKFCGSILN
jgi:hypothetical protein